MAWLSSPFWGRIVDRYGCRAVMVFCGLSVAPLFFAWLFVDSIPRLYAIELPASILSGFGAAGLSIATNTLIYKVTPSEGRSMQLAVYSIIVMVCAAPMPAIGGHLPGWLAALGIHSDVRCTFYVVGFITIAAALLARRIKEPGGRATSELVRDIPRHIISRSGAND